jgi:nicotinate-nucleotide adenylyltransferase
MRLGLYGGTFDPVHRGHLEVARRVRDELALDRLVWVVAGDPPHKRQRELSPAAHRLRMVELALAGTPGMDVCEAETLRPGPNYSIDTLRAFRALLPGARLFFVVGADSLLDLPGWRGPREILGCGVVAVPRPGFDTRAVPAWVRRRVRMLREPHVDLAATGLRERLRAGRDVGREIPAPVQAYILAHRLYRAAAAASPKRGPGCPGRPGAAPR